MSMCILTAQARTKRWPRAARPAFPLQMSAQNGFYDMSMTISTAQARTKRWPRATRPAFSLYISKQNGTSDMSMCISTAQACRGSRAWHFPCTFPRPMALVTCPGAFRVHRLSWNGRCGISVLHSPVHTGSCGLSLCLETSSKELARRSCQEICCVDLVRRSCQETSHRDLANRTLIKILYKDLGRRPLIEILHRDLVKRAEITLKDFNRHHT